MSDFANAIAKPEFAFKGLCPDLVAGEAARRKDGKLWCMPGGYAYVFKYKTFLPDKFWAIKCFSKLPPNLAIHYQTVSTYLTQSAVAHYFVFFKFIEKGIRTTDGKQHPILKMEWVNGANLKTYIRKNISDSTKLKKVAELFFKMCQELATHKVGHGDYHHENIFVVEEKGKISLKLIDYDSFYVADWKKDLDEVTQGYDGFQHPLRAIQVTKRCLQVDYFSQLVIYLSILAFAEDKSLWHKQRIDDRDGLLFTVNDFREPDKSAIITALSGYIGEISRVTDILKSVCTIQDIYQISPLENMLVSSGAKKSGWISNKVKLISKEKPVAPQPVITIQPINLAPQIKSNLSQPIQLPSFPTVTKSPSSPSITLPPIQLPSLPKTTSPPSSPPNTPTPIQLPSFSTTTTTSPASKPKWVPKRDNLPDQTEKESKPPANLNLTDIPTDKVQWVPKFSESTNNQNKPDDGNIADGSNFSDKSRSCSLPIWLYLFAVTIVSIFLWSFLHAVNTKNLRSPAEECRVQHPAQRNLCFE